METTDQLKPLDYAAGRLGCGVRRVRELIKAGELEAVRLGPKIVRVSPDAVKAFIERGGAAGGPGR